MPTDGKPMRMMDGVVDANAERLVNAVARPVANSPKLKVLRFILPSSSERSLSNTIHESSMQDIYLLGTLTTTTT